MKWSYLLLQACEISIQCIGPCIAQRSTTRKSCYSLICISYEQPGKLLIQNKKLAFLHLLGFALGGVVVGGASGTHYVCVCKYHQNLKLKVDPCLPCSVQALTSKAVCLVHAEGCVMARARNVLHDKV